MIWILLIAFQFKHFFADFPLQGRYMLGKFRPGWDFFWPLYWHCMVHAFITFLICYLVSGFQDAFVLAGFDFLIHFTMDRIKAGPKYLGRFKDMQKPQFWWYLGLDQMVHHLTHYLIIWRLLA